MLLIRHVCTFNQIIGIFVWRLFVLWHIFIWPFPTLFINQVNYLRIHFDPRFSWKLHIKAKKSQLALKTLRMYWLLGAKSELSLENKILLHKVMLKPVWTYAMQLWGTASNSNIEILQRYQNKALRSSVNTPWYVTDYAIHQDRKIPFVREEIVRLTQW